MSCIIILWPWDKCSLVQPSHTVNKENINISIQSLLEFWSCQIVTNGNSWCTSTTANCNNNVIKILQHILKQTKPTFWKISRKKSFNKQVFLRSVFNCIHDFLTRNAQNEHTIQKKPVVLPDLSFFEMLLSNQTSPCKRSLQLQSDKLMSPVPPRKKSRQSQQEGTGSK